MDTLDRIRPKASSEIVGNRLVAKRFADHIRDGKEPRVLAVVGPTGCGKSLMCSLVFKELSIKCYDCRTKEAIASCADTLSCLRERAAILIEDADVLGSQALAPLRAAVPLLKRSGAYIVFTCRPCEQRALSARFKDIEVFSMAYPPTRDTFAYLLRALDCEDEEGLLSLVKAYRGNIREVVMNSGQARHETSIVVNDRGFKEYNVFDVAGTFLSSPGWGLVDRAMSVDPDTVTMLVYENVVNEAHARDPSSVMETYAYVNSCMIDGTKIERSDNGIAHCVKLGGVCVALSRLNAGANARQGGGSRAKLRFPRNPRRKPPASDIPIMDIVNLVECGKMENCFVA